MGCDDQRELYPAIFAAVRVGLISIDAPLLRLVIHWLGDYARLKQQPGQAGVPEGLPAALTALAEAYAAVSDSRQRQEFCADAAGSYGLAMTWSWVRLKPLPSLGFQRAGCDGTVPTEISNTARLGGS